MMVRLELSRAEVAYLLGATGIALRQAELRADDLTSLTNLRDRLALHLDLDEDVAQALGLLTLRTIQ